MIKHIIEQLVIFISSCTLLTCAEYHEQAQEPEVNSISTASDCIFEGTIRDYRVLDESNLVVTASASRKYHIEPSRRAYGLDSSWAIGFSSPGGSICAGFSEIVVDDSCGPEAIRINKIRRLSPDEDEDMLIRFGKKQPELEQPREPEEVKGAEVEELD